MPTGDFVAYYRVSTAKQGRSGLGLEAQQQAVSDYLNGGDWRLTAEFTEVESGKSTNRPQLAKALARCRVTGAKLVVAKLDRLARNVLFLATLRTAGVPFVAADMPDANEMTVNIMAAIAQGEAAAISQRTKDALKAAKERGTKLGGLRVNSRPPSGEERQAGIAARVAKADSKAGDLVGIIADVCSGLGPDATMRAVARELMSRGIRTPSGKTDWQPVQVQRVIDRAGSIAA
jgi:DNA invertase Pin-like site-specific DNA recombinase